MKGVSSPDENDDEYGGHVLVQAIFEHKISSERTQIKLNG